MRKVGIMSAVATAALLTAGQACAATVLVVAGGGGGGTFNRIGDSGQSGQDGSAGGGSRGGSGGVSGAGGAAGDFYGGGGGAGLYGAGGTLGFGSGGATGPSFSGGAAYNDVRDVRSGAGGYGGGGGGTSYGSGTFSGGGGGGYSGGGGGAESGGGGGGSYIDSSLSAINMVSPSSPGSTNGYITISLLGADPFSTRFDYTGAVQSYTFKSTGRYSIVAAGGQGGSPRLAGGLGAVIAASGLFTADSTLDLIVGGGGSSSSVVGGGGGGSFVFQTYVAPGVSAVPEPATWAMMIAGFGAIGVAMRRRRQTVSVRFA